MICTLSNTVLLEYVIKQLNSIYPDQHSISADNKLMDALATALDRLEYCFRDVAIKNYHKDGEVYFDHLHTDQYSQFLYFFSNSIWKSGLNENISKKLMGLNRMLSGMFVSYKCELPRILLFYHAVGTVIGNAIFNDYLVVFQNVTINTSDTRGNGQKPIMGKGVFLGAGSKIIGSPRIGDRVSIGADCFIYNEDIEDDFIAINVDGKTEIKRRRKNMCHTQDFFRSKL